MNNPLLRRALAYAVTFFLAITLNFILPRAMPGEPLALIAGDAVRQMGAQRIAELRRAYGLDLPLHEQYLRYLGRLARGDLGMSYRYSGGQSVSQVLADRFAWTLLLVSLSMALATVAGSVLGALAANSRGTARDLGITGALYALRSMPPFWLAMIFISVFAVTLRWFPSGDTYTLPRPTGLAGVWDVLRHLILPMSVLALSYMPTAYAIMRTAMIGVLSSDYIRTARAKGVPHRGVLFRHALRNALLPVLTSFVLDLGQMLGGATLIEVVFNYRGIGNMMLEAVKTRDYPLLQGGFLLFAAGVIVLNLLSEWLYQRLDPRVRDRSEAAL